MDIGEVPAALFVNGVITKIRIAYPADINASAKQRFPRSSV